MYALKWFAQAFALALIFLVMGGLALGGFFGCVAAALSFALTCETAALGACLAALLCGLVGLVGLRVFTREGLVL